MSAQIDGTTPRIDEVVASTQEQLKEGRRLVEEAKRLARSTEEQASTARELAEETEQLLSDAQATIQRADALTHSEPQKDGSE
jgi:methyl-accepting chemotaxis protein